MMAWIRPPRRSLTQETYIIQALEDRNEELEMQSSATAARIKYIEDLLASAAALLLSGQSLIEQHLSGRRVELSEFSEWVVRVQTLFPGASRGPFE